MASTGSNDLEYATNFYIWEHIEPNASLIAACLPTFAPLLNASLIKTFSTRMRSFFSSRSRGSGAHVASEEGKYSNLASAESASTMHLAQEGGRTRGSSGDQKERIIKKTTEVDVELGPLPPKQLDPRDFTK